MVFARNLKELERWKEPDSWHDRLVFVLDGGICFFMVRYDVSRSRSADLDIMHTIAGPAKPP
jgi:hypothetical protein